MAGLVIVTGAGASHRLGVDNGKPPLMPGWAADLCDRLGPLTDLLGLTRTMDPEPFEDALGRFLRFTRNLPDVAAYPSAGLTDHSASDAEVQQWFAQAASTSDQILEGIYSSLHDLFARARISGHAARSAYGALFRALHVAPLTYVTTNYDLAGEIALDELDLRPYAGIDASWNPGQPQRLHYEDLTAQGASRTPVLHLHGRVGWYFAPEGHAIAVDPDAAYRTEYGTPALLLPDPKKAYEDVVSQSIWQQFRVALQQADFVFVLGHSLNDDNLRAVLRDVPDPKLAISIYASAATPPDTWQGAAHLLLESLGRSPHVIPMDFGPEPVADAQRIGQFIGGNAPEHNAHGDMVTL